LTSGASRKTATANAETDNTATTSTAITGATALLLKRKKYECFNIHIIIFS
jgi:hypothetical protein